MQAETHYTHTAYNSQATSLQVPPENKSTFTRILETGQEILPWTQPIRTICTKVYGGVLPSGYQRIRQENGGKLDDWNHKTLMAFQGNGWMSALSLLGLLGKVFVLFVGPVTILSCLFFLFAGDSFSSTLVFFSWYFFLFGLPGLIIWKYQELHVSGRFRIKAIEKKLASFKYFELNRETGMVTLFDKDGSVKFSHPFLEFDCIFQTIPVAGGALNHRLMLKHRYTDYAEGVPLHVILSVKGVSSDYYRLWNMIQLYMDISQPLPDTYYLEEFRSLDPTTKAYDEETGRNPTYWRDMNDQEYVDAMLAIERRQSGFNETLGNKIDIFQAT
ncbi:MARVEL domain-containing protein [Vibrio salinus]|uniref:MARVEL domain-containing protein n=1 Tax=Vibrio salinus TaxID=2899784 RepID=UPI001E4A2675|nr:MARVEL domain-containing protein [Vibrio salinus]MCE0495150.1 MARVEL domain-containing protein [Vibrio salinus]